MKTHLTKPLILIGCILLILGMLRAGVWQLDRADQKQRILDQQQNLAVSQPVKLREGEPLSRFQPVEVKGRYLAEKTLLLDNQVLDTRVGYRVFTPLRIAGTDTSILVDRGWIGVGESRATLPEVKTSTDEQRLLGRLNNPAAAPPLWDDTYSPVDGRVWQYLPIKRIAAHLQLELLPMVVELPPEFDGEADPKLVRRWASIDDKWVARHEAYAFQWFAMALTLFIACLTLLFIGLRRQSKSS